jgi:autotransporter-associated beta strand protein
MKTLFLSAIRCSLMFLVPSVTYAISAQWDLDPISGDWNTAANWTPNAVPNGPSDTATFALSKNTDVSIFADTEVNSIIFSPAATNPYTITASANVTLTISGAGIINNSGIAQNFVTNGGQFSGQIRFTNHATAGSFTIFTNNHGVGNFGGGNTSFFDTSSAGSATFINENGAVGGLFPGFMHFSDNSTASNATIINQGSTLANIGNGGGTGFLDTSSAGEATIINNGGAANNAGGGSTFFADSSTAASATFTNNAGMVSGAFGGSTGFIGNATAANGVFINDGGTVSGAGGGETFFSRTSTAGNSTLIANGGMNGGLGGAIFFIRNSTGGTARVEVFGNGNLDISEHFLSPLGVTVGSIEGDGNVFLGANNLREGSNNLSTTFSGVIQDGGFGGGDGGSLSKIGTGTLILSSTNTYTGNTNVRHGALRVDGSITSNTFVYASGSLSGTGTVYGDVTNDRIGRVGPGEALGVPGVLTVVHNYTQAQYATLMIQIAGTSTGDFSVLNVLGIANLNGNLAPVLLNGFVPTVGDSFTFLNYASFTGAFSQILNQVFNHGTEQWSVIYQNNNAILMVKSRPPGVPDQGSTFLFLTLGLLGLVTYRRQLLRGQP